MIGWYVHHQGGGHLARARSVAAVLDEPTVALSSLPAPADPSPFADWVPLGDDPSQAEPHDAEAGGALHWAPLSSPHYRVRMAQVAAWITAARPRLVVVDVSVEVAVLVRSLGVPVVVVALPGDRADRPHELAHRVAHRIVAPWQRSVLEPLHLAPFAAKVRYVGAISRFDDRGAVPPPRRRRVALLLGRGGHEVTGTNLRDAVAATRGWTWTGVDRAVPEAAVWDHLTGADVVVAHSGLGAVAEIAAARRSAVLVPQPRPYGEQNTTAAALDRAGLAQVATRWPEPAMWSRFLARAAAADGARWSAWNDGCGARRFAAVLQEGPL